MGSRAMNNFDDNAKRWTDVAKGAVNIPVRAKAFKRLLKGLPVTSILEAGCNMGFNLMAIKTLGNYELYGSDLSDYAIEHAVCPPDIKLTCCDFAKSEYQDNSVDMVLMCGLLNWLHYDELEPVIKRAFEISRKYILLIDHFHPPDSFPKLSQDAICNLEYLVCNQGKPMFWIRDFEKHFKRCTKVYRRDKIPELSDIFPMGAILYKKED
ncbi:MAG: class I SAM-dependent methyltransferase [Dehalococcoidia bacterium]|nr:class I SAM-dependent methyltransferase [Dehalococcoidia bacterium]